MHKSWLGEICSAVSQTVDQGIGTTFDAHVMAGYRFLMRYYDSVRPGPSRMNDGFRILTKWRPQGRQNLHVRL